MSVIDKIGKIFGIQTKSNERNSLQVSAFSSDVNKVEVATKKAVDGLIKSNSLNEVKKILVDVVFNEGVKDSMKEEIRAILQSEINSELDVEFGNVVKLPSVGEKIFVTLFLIKD